MKKSFGGRYGGGGGGSGGGKGGDMLRSAGRVVRTKLNNFQESLPSPNSSTTKKSSSSSSTKTTKGKKTSSKHALSLSSTPPYSNYGHPLSLSSAWPLPLNYVINNKGVSVNDDDDNDNGVIEVDSEWECLENYYDPIFGVVPSTHEVQDALLSLQNVFHPLSSSQSVTEERPYDVDIDMDDDQTKSSSNTLQRASSKGSSETDWIEPSMLPYDWKLRESPGWGRVHDAFHLLQTDPSVQRMVVSLSSDKAVWDAVLNNEAVQEIRDSYRDASESIPSAIWKEKSESSKENIKLLKWMFENVKIKLLDILENISQFLGEIFEPFDPVKEEQSYIFTDKLKSTFLLTVVILLIVVIARGHMG